MIRSNRDVDSLFICEDVEMSRPSTINYTIDIIEGAPDRDGDNK